MSYFTHKQFTLLSITMIFCQLFLVSSFLFISPVLAEDAPVDPPTEETPTDPIITETPAPETPPADPPVDPATTTPEIIPPAPPVDEATTTPPVLPDPANTPTATTTEPASPNLGGPSGSGSSAPNWPNSSNLDEPGATSTEPIATTTEPIIETGTTTPEFVPTPSPASPDASLGGNVMIIGAGSGSTGGSETSLTLDTTPDPSPKIMASWSMNNTRDADQNYLGADDQAEAGAQFLPSGQYQVNKTITVCAIATSETSEVKNVYAKFYYPENTAVDSATTTATVGCGKNLGSTLSLERLSKSDGLELFCSKLKDGNNNLPIFNNNTSYDALCAPSGALQTGTAQVYCQEKNLAYQDPSGDYQIKIYAESATGAFSLYTLNTFKYLELTAFAVDFDSINYGPVQLNTPKVIFGNLDWETPLGDNPATIMNVGNTRLRLVVKQNDFGLGGTPGSWHVGYQIKVGADSSFISYQPETPTTVDKVMNLAEINALDFGIEVYSFPAETSAYAGQMTLSAVKVEHLTCQ